MAKGKAYARDGELRSVCCRAVGILKGGRSAVAPDRYDRGVPKFLLPSLSFRRREVSARLISQDASSSSWDGRITCAAVR